jgi:hypothetical protein
MIPLVSGRNHGLGLDLQRRSRWQSVRGRAVSRVRHLVVMGKLVRPRGVKTEAVTLKFLPDVRHNETKWADSEREHAF